MIILKINIGFDKRPWRKEDWRYFCGLCRDGGRDELQKLPEKDFQVGGEPFHFYREGGWERWQYHYFESVAG